LLHRLVAWGAIVVCLLAFWTPQLAARPAQTGIQGRDDRQIVDGPGRPWQSIGRINNNGRSFCTGVLIGPRQVLTAAHCVRSHIAGRAWSPPSALHFLAGYTRGEYLAYSGVIALSIVPSKPGLSKYENDIAVLTLAAPIGSSIGYLPVEKFDRVRWLEDRKHGVLYSQAGYSHDKSHILTRHRECSITGFAENGRLFMHACDATHGDSGSPILVKRGSAYAIVGIHVASSRSGGNGIAVPGQNISAGIAAMLKTMPLAFNR
jgi:protease YdgD